MKNKQFCTDEEANEILSKIKPLKDLEKINWYVGYLRGLSYGKK